MCVCVVRTVDSAQEREHDVPQLPLGPQHLVVVCVCGVGNGTRVIKLDRERPILHAWHGRTYAYVICTNV